MIFSVFWKVKEIIKFWENVITFFYNFFYVICYIYLPLLADFDSCVTLVLSSCVLSP